MTCHTPIIAIIGEDPLVAMLLQRIVFQAVPTATVLIAPETVKLPPNSTPNLAFIRASSHHLSGFSTLR